MELWDKGLDEPVFFLSQLLDKAGSMSGKTVLVLFSL